MRSLAHDEIEIDTLLAGETEIDRAINQAYGYELSIDGILHEIETGEIDFRGLQSSADEYSQPVVRLIDSILTDAVKRESSDVHFEPETGFLRIRYRIDGMLRQVRSLHQSYWPAMARLTEANVFNAIVRGDEVLGFLLVQTDGAGAAVLSSGDGYTDSLIRVSGGDTVIKIPQFIGNSPFYKGEQESPYVHMNGQETFRFAVNGTVAWRPAFRIVPT